MKKVFLLFLSVAFVLASCTNSYRTIEKVSNDFLSHYFAMEYDAAWALCTPDLARNLETTTSEIEYPTEQVREAVEKASKGTTFQIMEIDNKSIKNRALVKYVIIVAGSSKQIEKSMTLELTGGEWKISDMR